MGEGFNMNLFLVLVILHLESKIQAAGWREQGQVLLRIIQIISPKSCYIREICKYVLYKYLHNFKAIK